MKRKNKDNLEGKMPSLVLVDEKIKRIKHRGNVADCDSYIAHLETRLNKLKSIREGKVNKSIEKGVAKLDNGLKEGEFHDKLSGARNASRTET